MHFHVPACSFVLVGVDVRRSCFCFCFPSLVPIAPAYPLVAPLVNESAGWALDDGRDRGEWAAPGRGWEDWKTGRVRRHDGRCARSHLDARRVPCTPRRLFQLARTPLPLPLHSHRPISSPVDGFSPPDVFPSPNFQLPVPSPTRVCPTHAGPASPSPSCTLLLVGGHRTGST